MATFGEMVYMVMDLLKERSDDTYYTEEHILFLLNKVRAFLLDRKYKNSRNSTFNEVSDENRQQICLSLSPAKLLPTGCGGNWLKSNEKIPDTLSIDTAVTCTGHDLLPTNVTFIPKERMPYVGHNKWLQKIIYAAKSEDGHLYLTSNNPQFLWLEHVGLTGVFSDPEEAAKMSHEACENGGVCDIMTQSFPLEAALVPSCIEFVVQEITGARYTPDDMVNNAKDDLSNAAIAQMRTAKPVEDSTYKRRYVSDESEPQQQQQK